MKECGIIMRDLHKECFPILQMFIDIEVLQNQKILSLYDVFNRHINILLDRTTDFTKQDFNNYKLQKLEEKLKSCYGNQITITSSAQYNNKKVIFKSGLDITRLIYQLAIEKNYNLQRFQNVAYELRRCVTNINPRHSDVVNPKTIMFGDCEISDLLFNFVCSLVQGPDIDRKES